MDDDDVEVLERETKGEVKVFTDVTQDNERYWRCRSSFSLEYFDFVGQVLTFKSSPEILKFSL